MRILRLEGLAFLLSLSALLVYRMLTRQINLSGLLLDKSGAGQVSAERVQLLLATMAVSFKFLGAVLHGNCGSLPDVSPQMLGLFGMSGGLYATVKAFRTFRAS